MKVAFVGFDHQIAHVFGCGRREEVERRADVVSGVPSLDDPRMAEVEAIFSTWGMPKPTSTQFEKMPALKAVFYAAGAVDHFAVPFLERGLIVTSAWHANAIPVAEFVTSQILLACKGYFANVRTYPDRQRAPGVYGETVALLGVGAVGSKVVELLRPFKLNVIVFDPFLTPDRAEALGVRQVSLSDAFREGYVVSNHLLNVPETRNLIDGNLLSSMRHHSTFINTGRGQTVAQDELVQVLNERPDLTALLDVVDPEPLPPGHPLSELPNAFVSSHIAGSIGDEVLRLADWTIEEFDRYLTGAPLLYRVTA